MESERLNSIGNTLGELDYYYFTEVIYPYYIDHKKKDPTLQNMFKFWDRFRGDCDMILKTLKECD